MCEQNLPKLWRWYEFTVHNHLWNSEIVPHWIQHKISKKVTETDSQKRLSNSKTVNNTELFTLTMCLSACLWVPIAKTPFNYTITAQTLLAKCVDYRFQRSILQFPALGKKTAYRKHVHHKPSTKYVLTCWQKRVWLHVLWDNWNYFLKFVRIE